MYVTQHMRWVNSLNNKRVNCISGQNMAEIIFVTMVGIEQRGRGLPYFHFLMCKFNLSQ